MHAQAVDTKLLSLLPRSPGMRLGMYMTNNILYCKIAMQSQHEFFATWSHPHFELFAGVLIVTIQAKAGSLL